MPIYTKKSLELLRQRINLTDVVGAHIDLKKSGATYKALCPFHEEKTPSFIINRGDEHYHCFGCAAHGDAIAFLMNYLKMGFIEAVESLAEKFGVALEHEEHQESKGPSKTALRETLQLASQFYHFMLLHTEEGHTALSYLYNRGIDLDFIRRFQIGVAPKQKNALYTFLQTKEISFPIIEAAGLLQPSEKEGPCDFFSNRIMFPILDSMGHVIGFSGRKFQETTFGGKYINSCETPLFKKSQILFGLSYCRKKIAQTKKALIVEGQIDSLRLIQEGFDFTVAGQGTAFSEGQVKELLQLGVQNVFLALDGDLAGEDATVKIGELFQKKGVEVNVVSLPHGQDPDTILRENGPSYFKTLLSQSVDYLTFLIKKLSTATNINSPSGKTAITNQIVEQIRGWEHPVMIHESLKKVAKLLQLPEELLDTSHTKNFFMQKKIKVSQKEINPDLILETDFLRLLFLAKNKTTVLFPIAKDNIAPSQLTIAACQRLYAIFIDLYQAQKEIDLLSFVSGLEKEEESSIITEILNRKIHIEKAEETLLLTIQRILERNWMEKKELIKQKLHTTPITDEETIELAKQFDFIQKNPPKIV
jgi:DNA primase